jgi:hypothetical protein
MLSEKSLFQTFYAFELFYSIPTKQLVNFCTTYSTRLGSQSVDTMLSRQQGTDSWQTNTHSVTNETNTNAINGVPIWLPMKLFFWVHVA